MILTIAAELFAVLLASYFTSVQPQLLSQVECADFSGRWASTNDLSLVMLNIEQETSECTLEISYYFGTSAAQGTYTGSAVGLNFTFFGQVFVYDMDVTIRNGDFVYKKTSYLWECVRDTGQACTSSCGLGAECSGGRCLCPVPKCATFDGDGTWGQCGPAPPTPPPTQGPACMPAVVSSRCDTTACGATHRCASCEVKCAAGYSSPVGEIVGQLRCLSYDSPLRSYVGDDFLSQCTADEGRRRRTFLAHVKDNELAFFANSRCGLAACCPAQPLRLSTCRNELDTKYPGQCDYLLGRGYTCLDHFCPTCGPLAGFCDKLCSFGDCRVCGDCYRDAPLAHGARATCDDGNLEDGDGCSSTCEVEDGYVCRPYDSTTAGPDVCEQCVDVYGWRDAMGYTCDDYRAFQACDVDSQPSDPLAVGGRVLETPSYHSYRFAYDVGVSSSTSLRIRFTVRAKEMAHMFVGRPGVRGFEVILGGWANTKSALRTYPGGQQISHYYASEVHEDEDRPFWLEYQFDGSFSVGRGESYGQEIILGNDDAPRVKHAVERWADTDSGVTMLDQVFVATGWGFSGVWKFRVDSGTTTPTIGEMTGLSGVSTGLDASEACCVCGRSIKERLCEMKDQGTLPTTAEDRPTLSPMGSTVTRRMATTGVPHFVGDVEILGPPTADGLLLRIALGGCEAGTVCTLHAIVLPARVLHLVTLPLARVWTQVRRVKCRLRGDGWAAQVGNLTQWQALECGLTGGTRWAVVVHLHSDMTDEISNVTFEIPPAPTASAQQLSFTDQDPNPRLAAGLVTVVGASDEAGILQYRLYWGRGGGVKVDSDLALAGVINTFGTGGFRNGQSNECLFNDCAWRMEKVQTHRRRGRYAIRHESTGDCLCFRLQQLESMACPPELVQNGQIVVDHPDTYHEIYRDGQTLRLDWTSVDDLIPLPSDCLWKHEDLLINDTTETRLENVRYAMCMCQVPVTRKEGIDGQPLPPPTGAFARELVMNRYCRLQYFGMAIEGVQVPTTGYCEWTNYGVDPHPSADPRADARRQEVVSLGATAFVEDKDGIQAWRLAGEEGLIVNTPQEVGPNHTFAAWINLKGFNPLDPVNHPGIVKLFNATNQSGANSPCLMLKQRTLLDDRNPICPDDICDGAELMQCCTSTTTTTTSTTSTTATTTTATTTTNITDDELFDTADYNSTTVTTTTRTTATTSTSTTSTTTAYVCRCTCPWPDPPYPAGVDPTLPGDSWGVGLQACGSAATWESGFDVKANAGAESGWILLAAVGSGTTDGKGQTSFYASLPERPEVFSFEGEFACSSQGCMASAFIRNVPRDETQTCSLAVEVNTSNCVLGVVESIVVWGGNPKRKQMIRESCRPGCGHTKPFKCVHAHGVDNFVGGASASRVVRIDVHLVDHPNVTGVDGVARITCKRLHFANKRAPPSGALRKVGVAGRTCAGSILEDIGTSMGAASSDGDSPEIFVAQAWAWDHAFDEAELDALFHSTRIRYYPYYYTAIGTSRASALVAEDIPSIRVVEELKCRTPTHSCVVPRGDRKTLGGLPTDYNAQCKLSVKVAITDFSDQQETVEYIRLIDLKDESNYLDITTNCWPGRDDAADEFYYCLYEEDVSQSTLNNAYMFNGQVDIEIVLSHYVDSYPTLAGDVLHALVEMVCTGTILPDHVEAFAAVDRDDDAYITTWEAEQAFISLDVFNSLDRTGDGILQFDEWKQIRLEDYATEWSLYRVLTPDRRSDTFGKVEVPADTLELMLVAASDQGEGPPFSLPFHDRVNGFLVPPKIIGQATYSAVAMTTLPTDKEGMIWVHGVLRDTAHTLTASDIYNGIEPGLDMCMGHNWRWPVQIKYWLSNQVLWGCKFENKVPYSVVIYVDRANAPFGGGTLVVLDFVYTKFTYQVEGQAELDPFPEMRPLAAVFQDNDVRVRYINGTLTITRAYYEDDFTHYYVFWGEGNLLYPRTWENHPAPIATVEATGQQEYVVVLGGPSPSDALKFPCLNCDEVNTLLVFCWNDNNTDYRWYDPKLYRRVRPAELKPSDRRYVNENNYGIYDLSVNFVDVPTIKEAGVRLWGQSTVYSEFKFTVRPNNLMVTKTFVDVAIVEKGTEVTARATRDYKALDLDPQYINTGPFFGCAGRMVFGQQDENKEFTFGTNVCYLKPGEEYALVTNIAMDATCLCRQPCYCVGQLNTEVALAPDSQFMSLSGTSSSNASTGRYFRTPDLQAPAVTLHCGNRRVFYGFSTQEVLPTSMSDQWNLQCANDFYLSPRITLTDPGKAYPAMVLCAACRQGTRRRRIPVIAKLVDDPGACIRSQDSRGHRAWRIRVPMGNGSAQCGTSGGVRFEEIRFFLLTDKNADGELLRTSDDLWTSSSTFSGPFTGFHNLAFDNNEYTYMEEAVATEDVWVGIDFGTDPTAWAKYVSVDRDQWVDGVPLLRARVFYDSLECAARQLYLEWSDDMVDWKMHGWAKTDDTLYDKMMLSVAPTPPATPKAPAAYDDSDSINDDTILYGSNLNPAPNYCHMRNMLRNPDFEDPIAFQWRNGGGGRITRELRTTMAEFGMEQTEGWMASIRRSSLASDLMFWMYQTVDISPCARQVDEGFLKLEVTGRFWAADTPQPTPSPTPSPPTDDYYDYYVYSYYYYSDEDPAIKGDGSEENVRFQIFFFDAKGQEMTQYRFDSGARRPNGWEMMGIKNQVVPVGTRSLQVNFTVWEQLRGKPAAADDFVVRLTHRPHHDIALHMNVPEWYKNVRFPEAWTGESARHVPISGLTAGSDYDIYCYAVDDRGNDASYGPISATTTDSRGPDVEIKSVSVTDFTATTVLTMTDPGGGYPAVTNCFAQQPAYLVPPPPVSMLKTKNQECTEDTRVWAPTVNNGRVPYVEALSTRAYLYAQPHVFKQNSWGASRKTVMRSCGLRHEQAYGPGGCRASGLGRQKVELIVMIRAAEEASIFVGGEGRGGLGYEVVFGSAGNTQNELRKGYSKATFNEDLPYSAIVKTSNEKETPDHRRRRRGRAGPDRGGEILDEAFYRLFWISIDPSSGWIRVGEGDTFKHDVVIQYHDTDPIMILDRVYMGAAYRSAGLGGDANGLWQGGVGFINFVVCPRYLNLARGKVADSSDEDEGLPLAFGGSADKMVDGLVGDNTFCEYCHQQDYRHVCAATRKGSRNTPWIRATLGFYAYVYGVRLVVPEDSHPGQRHLQIWLGDERVARQYKCKDIKDAGGDHFYVCDDVVAGGRGYFAYQVSVYGVPASLAPLPSEFGIRVCELELYENILEESPLYVKQQQVSRPLATAEPDVFVPDLFAGASVHIEGLMPGTWYEFFCYAEDLAGNGAMSNRIRITTPDNTPPTLTMKVGSSMYDRLIVEVNVTDPGNSYPVLAKCAATHKGLTPQEHDQFFEHRFWKLTLDAPGDWLDEDCKDMIRTAQWQLLSHNGDPLPGYVVYSSGTVLHNDVDFPGVIRPPTEEGPVELPAGQPYLMVDTMGDHPMAERIAMRGGTTRADLVIALVWDTMDDLQLRISVPSNDYNRDSFVSMWAGPKPGDEPLEGGAGTAFGGGFDVWCPDWDTLHAGGCWPPVESASWLLGPPGEYSMEVVRRDANWTDGGFERVKMTMFVRLCGRDYEHEVVMDEETHNMSLGTTFLENTGCHRNNHSKYLWRAWQSSVLDRDWPLTTPQPLVLPALPYSQQPARFLLDGHSSTCLETGGFGVDMSQAQLFRPTEDLRPWIRINLGEYLNIHGVWMLGKIHNPRFQGMSATKVDIYVVDKNLTFDDLKFDNVTYSTREALNRSIPTLRLGPGDDARIAVLLDATIKGNWIPDASGEPDPNGRPAVAIERTFDYEPTNASAEWWTCQKIATFLVDVYDLACVEIEVFPDFEGSLFAMTIGAFRVPDYTSPIDTVHVNLAYRDRVTALDVGDLNAGNLSWTLPPDAAVRPLCKAEAPVGDVDHMGMEGESGGQNTVPKWVFCDMPTKGTDLLFVANPPGAALSICELEVLTTPMLAATQAVVEFQTSNATDNICGAKAVKVEWADACADKSNASTCRWGGGWSRALRNDTVAVQQTNWSWYDRMFMLPFSTTFASEGKQNVEIPKLRENYTYDVFCWARDARGNELSQYLVSLPLIWAETHIQGSTGLGTASLVGKRRLQSLFEERADGLLCTPEMREVFPCEQRVPVADFQPPSTLRSFWSDMVEEVRIDIVDNQEVVTPTGLWQITWNGQLDDDSCENRDFYGIVCRLRCVLFDMDAVSMQLTLQPGLGCDAQDFEHWKDLSQCKQLRWSNNAALALKFEGLLEQHDYWLTCDASDPWGNTAQWRETFRTGTTPTAVPTSVPTPAPTREFNYVTGSIIHPEPRRRRRRYVVPTPPMPPKQTPAPTVPPTRPPVTYYAPEPVGYYAPIPNQGSASQRPTPPSVTWDASRPSATPRPAPPPRPQPGSFNMAPATTTEPPVIRATLPPGVVAPSAVHMGLALQVASAMDAQKVLLPAALKALAETVRMSLGLNADDTVDIISAEPRPSGRLLSSAGAQDDDGSGSTAWFVDVEVSVRVVGDSHAAGVYGRARALEEGSSGARELFTNSFAQALVRQQVSVSPPVLVGAILQQNANTGGSSSSGRTRTNYQAQGATSGSGSGTGSADEADDDDSSRKMMLYVGVVLVLCACGLFPLGVLGSIFFLKKTDVQVMSPSAKKGQRSSNAVVSSSVVAAAPASQEQLRAVRSDAAVLAPQVPAEASPPVVCKAAWKGVPNSSKAESTAGALAGPTGGSTPRGLQDGDPRAGTPISRCSTASGTGSRGSHSSGAATLRLAGNAASSVSSTSGDPRPPAVPMDPAAPPPRSPLTRPVPPGAAGAPRVSPRPDEAIRDEVPAVGRPPQDAFQPASCPPISELEGGDTVERQVAVPIFDRPVDGAATLPIRGRPPQDLASLPVAGTPPNRSSALPVVGRPPGDLGSLPVVGQAPRDTSALPVVGRAPADQSARSSARQSRARPGLR